MTEAESCGDQALPEHREWEEVISDLSFNFLISIVQTQWEVRQDGSLESQPMAEGVRCGRKDLAWMCQGRRAKKRQTSPGGKCYFRTPKEWYIHAAKTSCRRRMVYSRNSQP